MTGSSNRLASVDLDTTGLPTPTAEIEQERRVAIFDLLEDNSFQVVPRKNAEPPSGPYALALAVKEGRLVFSVSCANGDIATELHLSLTPFRSAVKDYFAICESYFEAIRRLPPHKIEAIDMGRRGIHDEGARLLVDRLEGKIEIDMPTAKRLFTLICVLHFRG